MTASQLLSSLGRFSTGKHRWPSQFGRIARLALALIVALTSALAPVLALPTSAGEIPGAFDREPVPDSGVTGVADAPLTGFLDLGSCWDLNLGVTAAGVGLFQFTRTGSIPLTLPPGATPDGAYVFWNGADLDDGAADSSVTWSDPGAGTSVLAPAQTYGGALWEPGPVSPEIHYAWSYRAGVAYSGSGTYTIADVGSLPGGTFSEYNNGAGMLALYRDPTLGAQRVQLAHGLDLMQDTILPSSGAGSAKLVFEFDPESQNRIADLISLVGGIGPPSGVQNELWYLTGSGPITATVPTLQDLYTTPGAQSISNPFTANDGVRWDTYDTSVTIPAGSEWIIIQLRSVPTNPADPTTAPRMEWIAQSLALPLDCPNLGNQTFLDWNNNGVYDPGIDQPFPNNITVSLLGSEMGFSDSTTALGGVDQGAPGDAGGGNYLFADLHAPGTYTATVPPQPGYSATTPLQQIRAFPPYPAADWLDVDFGFLPQPGLDIVKVAGNAPDGTTLILPAPASVTYAYAVTNTGLTYLTNVTVNDNILGFICQEAGPVAPGASFTCTKTVTISDDTTNVGSATARHPILAAIQSHPARYLSRHRRLPMMPRW